MIVQGDALRLPFPDRVFDLVIGSPPYLDARLYLEEGLDFGIARGCIAWVEWLLEVTDEALRVSKGLVVWVCAGKTDKWNYQPGPEMLLAEWFKRGGHAFRPVYWHRSGIPGSGGRQWYRADIEYCLAFKRPGELPYADPKANGHKPKWGLGGEMSNRGRNGSRVNQWGGHVAVTYANKKGRRVTQNSPNHVYAGSAHGQKDDRIDALSAIANPGNMIHTSVGGGKLGHKMAHENEAPYPVAIPAFFIASHAPSGGLVLDPFAGSSSTGQAALESGRRYVGLDLRRSQCLLSRKRLATITPGFRFEG
jgi:hypothetical protein